MSSNPTLRGLTAAEVAERRARCGPNEIGPAPGHGWWHTAGQVLSEPMFLLLLAAAAIYLVLGDLGEGLLLAFFALVTVGLVFGQERRSERAIEALRSLAAPQVRVLREGRVRRIAARELVPGDVFLLGEGERIAADAVLREAVGLAVDESLLSGESMPVRKVAAAGAATPAPVDPGGDDLPFVYAATLVTAGHGLAEVLSIGAATRVGRIGASLNAIDTGPTAFERHLRRLVRLFSLGALAASAVLALWYGLVRGLWLQGLLAGIALSMAMLPEEFPMALAVFLALGAWRLAGVQVLARRPAVIEALGAVTLLCVDKTGTLTENRMRLRRLTTGGIDVDVAAGAEALPEPVHALLEYGMLASRRGGVDPMDLAILALGDRQLAATEHLHPQWLLEQEYPLTPALLAMSQAWTDADGTRRVAAKGAPEAIADLCHLDAAGRAALLGQVAALAGQGLRVIAVARGTGAPGAPALDAHDDDFTLLGLMSFEDPLRPSVAAAVAEARAAGISVAMITGDHASTALAIARQAGIETAAGALTGAAIDGLDAAGLAEAVRGVRVFARVMPEQKLRLVLAFQALGETVAMTGDGVNDAPALKAAHIGIAMGVRGTDVAREAASLVLLDEDFGRIVDGVRMGRRIFDNLRKVMTYITAIHVPIVGLAVLPLLIGLPPLMLPVHIVLIEMVIDPACTLAFESAPEDPGLMRRPPRRSDAGIIGWPMLVQGLAQGASLLAVALAIDAVAIRLGLGEDAARTLSIIGLMVGNLLLVWVNAAAGAGWRSLFTRQAAAFRAVAGAAASALVAAVAWPLPRRLLHFAVP
ncbi:MAG: HAD-IC family P-type ATPase, partial [Burkholderiales bacterium]|nr:HAD-IC family P-type ATPase [Burkholderiales bacterium]